MVKDTQMIGVNIDKALIKKLEVISFVTKKNRTNIIHEALEDYVLKNEECFNVFAEMAQDVAKKYTE